MLDKLKLKLKLVVKSVVMNSAEKGRDWYSRDRRRQVQGFGRKT